MTTKNRTITVIAPATLLAVVLLVAKIDVVVNGKIFTDQLTGNVSVHFQIEMRANYGTSPAPIRVTDLKKGNSLLYLIQKLLEMNELHPLLP